MQPRRIIRNVAVNYAAMGVNIIVSVASVPLLIGILGKGGYGYLALLITYTAAGFYALLDLGLRDAVTKFIAEDHALGRADEVNKIFNSYCLFLLAVSLASFASNAFIFAYLLEGWLGGPGNPILGYEGLFLAYGAAALLFNFRIALDSLLEGMQLVAEVSWALILQKTLWMVFVTVVFFAAPQSPIAICAWGYLGSEVVAAAYMLFHARRNFPDFRVLPASSVFPSFHRVWRMARLLYVNRIGSIALSQFSRVLLGSKDVGTLAEFDIVSKFFTLLRFTMSSINKAIFPLTSALHARGDSSRVLDTFTLSSVIGGSFAVATATLIVVFPERFLHFWLRNDDYLALSGVLAFSVVWVYPNSIINAGSVMLNAVNRVGFIVPWNLAGTAAFILSAPWLLSRFGLYGMFAAITLAAVFPTPALIFGINKYLGIPYRVIFLDVAARLLFVSLAAWALGLLAGRFLILDTFLLFSLVCAGVLIAALTALFFSLDGDTRRRIVKFAGPTGG